MVKSDFPSSSKNLKPKCTRPSSQRSCLQAGDAIDGAIEDIWRAASSVGRLGSAVRTTTCWSVDYPDAKDGGRGLCQGEGGEGGDGEKQEGQGVESWHRETQSHDQKPAECQIISFFGARNSFPVEFETQAVMYCYFIQR